MNINVIDVKEKNGTGKIYQSNLTIKMGTEQTIENLIILCPNCHAQTPTFCRGGKRKYSTSMKMKEKKFQKKFRKQYLKNKEHEVSLLLKKKRQEEIKNRINDLKVINVRKFGWVQKLSEKWGVSHPQVRRFLKRHNPEIYINAFERKSGKRW